MTVVVSGSSSPELSTAGAYQLVSMTELLAELRARLRDPSAVSGRFTDTELYWCIKSGIRGLVGQVRLVGTYTTTFVMDERDYVVPAYIRDILRIRRGPIDDLAAVAGGKSVDVLSYGHVRTVLQNLIRFENVYQDGLTLTIDYLYDLQVPPAPTTLAAEVSSSATSLDVTGASHTWPLPGYAYLDSLELVAYDGASGGLLTGVTRGILGSTASTHSLAAVVDPVLPLEAGARDAIVFGAIAEAHRMRLEDGPQSDTSGSLTRYQVALARYDEARSEYVQVLPPKQVPIIRNQGRRRGPVVR